MSPMPICCTHHRVMSQQHLSSGKAPGPRDDSEYSLIRIRCGEKMHRAGADLCGRVGRPFPASRRVLAQHSPHRATVHVGLLRPTSVLGGHQACW
ncbi:hypothetical protein K466DRAFT_161778 [Polyporus arcularius HHB13444]|uniref:Uncharacterized protein n=1 Tax=Polyporus arcularius HHB13444 TaxID=1314778 RepID=A0A5C3PYG8_9APHY|nr:hypothetical protein K466DRAFT_161778 [Polyporus arcularius HHB13444]